VIGGRGALPHRISKRLQELKRRACPWVIVNEDRDESVGSSATKEAAEASIRARLAGEHGGFAEKKGRVTSA